MTQSRWKMKKETYFLERTIETPNSTIRVFRPDITVEERAKRMKSIHKAAETLLKSVKKGVMS